jgi:hypothetical protein
MQKTVILQLLLAKVAAMVTQGIWMGLGEVYGSMGKCIPELVDRNGQKAAFVFSISKALRTIDPGSDGGPSTSALILLQLISTPCFARAKDQTEDPCNLQSKTS